MRRLSSKKIRLNLKLKFLLKNGKTEKISRQSLRLFRIDCKKCPDSKKYILSVGYMPNISNCGTYTNKQDLLKALECFTNGKDLTFVEKYWAA